MNPPDNESRLMILVVLLLGFSLLEQVWPLRKTTQPRLPRALNNLLIAGSSALILKLAFYPLVLTVASLTAAENWGILSKLDLPVQARIPLAILALDWTALYNLRKSIQCGKTTQFEAEQLASGRIQPETRSRASGFCRSRISRMRPPGAS